MKSEKGITLTALVIYIVVFFIMITTMSAISDHFYKNVGEVKDTPKYIVEFNKFSMFFVADVKRNSQITALSTTSVEFPDGTEYMYQDNAIYRNGEKIVKYVKSFTFTESEYTEDAFTKKIINVNTTIGNDKEEITRNIDFVLKYW